MKSCIAIFSWCLLCALLSAQTAPKSVTVPFILDHNRVVIDVTFVVPDGSTQRIRAWVDNGNPDFVMSRRVAMMLNLRVTCDDNECAAVPPDGISIGDMKVSLAGVPHSRVPLNPVNAASVIAPGMDAEINIPSTVLRHYDVLIDFPGRKFTIGAPGTVDFRGASGKMLINAENGLVQLPSKLENKSYNLALDVGSSISFLSGELFDKLASTHSDWPHLTGGIGPANMWGGEDETQWKLMRMERVQYGPLFLTDVAVVDFPKDRRAVFEKRAGTPTAGLLGSSVFLNYRVGLDYANSRVFFEVGNTYRVPDFDVIGPILRPEDDGRYTILGVAAFEGKPSVPEVQAGDRLVAVGDNSVTHATMGQVWDMLSGMLGKERKLTIDRAGRQFTVVAKVQHFLGEVPDEEGTKKKSKRD